jgi:hypothetical protein
MLQPGVKRRPHCLFTCDSMCFSRALKETGILKTSIMMWFVIIILGIFFFKFIGWQKLEILEH